MQRMEPKRQRLKPKASAYVEALKLLARRELSEAQVRARLTRQGHDPDSVDTAVERLRTDRAIDDARVAEAIAHTEVAVRRRGRLRVKRQIEQAGIAAATARRIVESVFGDIDEAALLEAALARRLHGRARIAGDAEFARLFRHLVRQGFEPDAVIKALRSRARAGP